MVKQHDVLQLQAVLLHRAGQFGRAAGLSEPAAHLLEGLHSASINEVVVRLLDSPVDLAIKLAGLGHPKVVLLTVEVIKQRVQACSDVPSPLQRTHTHTSLGFAVGFFVGQQDGHSSCDTSCGQ